LQLCEQLLSHRSHDDEEALEETLSEVWVTSHHSEMQSPLDLWVSLELLDVLSTHAFVVAKSLTEVMEYQRNSQ
jgi:hypothetical protein